jgi:hypothetical protein
LLKADVSEAGKGWSDNRIIEALETSPSMVYRVRTGSLVTVTSPSIMRASLRERARPSPVPP